jgi:hypothetical protein
MVGFSTPAPSYLGAVPRGDEFRWFYNCPKCGRMFVALIEPGAILDVHPPEGCPHRVEVDETLEEIARGPRRWLPPEFRGERTFEQTLTDVRAIAGVSDETHVEYRRTWHDVARDPEAFLGRLTATGPWESALRFTVTKCDDESTVSEFELSAERFVRAGLETHDDADFFGLHVELDDSVVLLADGN